MSFKVNIRLIHAMIFAASQNRSEMIREIQGEIIHWNTCSWHLGTIPNDTLHRFKFDLATMSKFSDQTPIHCRVWFEVNSVEILTFLKLTTESESYSATATVHSEQQLSLYWLGIVLHTSISTTPYSTESIWSLAQITQRFVHLIQQSLHKRQAYLHWYVSITVI